MTMIESVIRLGSGERAASPAAPRKATAPESAHDGFIARRVSLAMPNEILDYYAWLFCQGGFVNLRMTFEQFLIVVATLWPSKLRDDHGG
jgi:hypothetical protein